MRVLFWEPIHGLKHLRGRHIPEHAQFKVLLPEGKMADTFWGMFSSRSWGTCFKGYNGGQEHFWGCSVSAIMMVGRNTSKQAQLSPKFWLQKEKDTLKVH
jgi:hypothetical protein